VEKKRQRMREEGDMGGKRENDGMKELRGKSGGRYGEGKGKKEGGAWISGGGKGNGEEREGI
jgi:hypothetical protein